MHAIRYYFIDFIHKFQIMIDYHCYYFYLLGFSKENCCTILNIVVDFASIPHPEGDSTMANITKVANSKHSPIRHLISWEFASKKIRQRRGHGFVPVGKKDM